MNLLSLLRRRGNAQLSFERRRDIYESLASKAESETPLSRALLMLYNNESADGDRETPASRCLLRWYQSVGGLIAGGDVMLLADASAGDLPVMERQFIRIGEMGRAARGKDSALAVGFAAAGKYAAAINQLQTIARSAWRAPLIGVIQFFVFIEISVRLVRFEASTFTGLRNTWPPLVELYFSACNWLAAWGWIFPIAALAGLIAVAYSLPRWTGPTREWLDRHAPIYSDYRRLHGAQSMSAIAYLLACRTTPALAVAALLDQASPWLRSYLDRIYLHLTTESGSLPMALLSAGGVFPDPNVCRALRDHESSGQFAADASRLLERENAQITMALERRIKKIAGRVLNFTLAVLLLFTLGEANFQLTISFGNPGMGF